MGSELFPVDDDHNVGQDVPAPQAIEIEEDVVGMSGELDAAVCRRGHLVSVLRIRNTDKKREGHELMRILQVDGLGHMVTRVNQPFFTTSGLSNTCLALFPPTPEYWKLLEASIGAPQLPLKVIRTWKTRSPLVFSSS